MNYEESLNYIHAVQWAGHKPGLTRTRTLLAALENPHKQLKFIHVAGTNGKGSTAAMLASCLQAAGYRVGPAGYAAWQKAKLPRFRLGVPDGTELAEEIDKLLDGSPSQTR